MGLLTGKTALITGAARGIGKAVAMKFAQEGANIAFTDLVLNDDMAAGLEATRKEIEALGVKCNAYAGNAADFAETEAVVNKIKEDFGSIDVLVNNAGVVDSGIEAIEKVSDATVDRLIDINAKGTIYMAREASKIMIEKKSGSVVNVASVAGYCGNGGAAYVSSKAAVIGLTKNMAMRCASVGVRCNAVCPGSVVTPMITTMDRTKLDMDMMGAMSKHADLTLPVCQPEEVANLLLFLSSEDSKAITGQVIVIDHGADL